MGPLRVRYTKALQELTTLRLATWKPWWFGKWLDVDLICFVLLARSLYLVASFLGNVFDCVLLPESRTEGKGEGEAARFTLLDMGNERFF